MRVVETKICYAINNGVSMKCGNTEVVAVNTESLYVELHGNVIFTRDGNIDEYRSCGWDTNVTRNRLNALSYNNGTPFYFSIKNGRMIAEDVNGLRHNPRCCKVDSTTGVYYGK